MTIARSFHLTPTYVQPAAPINCSKLFQGVNPRTWNTIATKMTVALNHLILLTLKDTLLHLGGPLIIVLSLLECFTCLLKGSTLLYNHHTILTLVD